MKPLLQDYSKDEHLFKFVNIVECNGRKTVIFLLAGEEHRIDIDHIDHNPIDEIDKKYMWDNDAFDDFTYEILKERSATFHSLYVIDGTYVKAKWEFDGIYLTFPVFQEGEIFTGITTVTKEQRDNLDDLHLLIGNSLYGYEHGDDESGDEDEDDLVDEDGDEGEDEDNLLDDDDLLDEDDDLDLIYKDILYEELF